MLRTSGIASKSIFGQLQRNQSLGRSLSAKSYNGSSSPIATMTRRRAVSMDGQNTLQLTQITPVSTLLPNLLADRVILRKPLNSPLETKDLLDKIRIERNMERKAFGLTPSQLISKLTPPSLSDTFLKDFCDQTAVEQLLALKNQYPGQRITAGDVSQKILAKATSRLINPSNLSLTELTKIKNLSLNSARLAIGHYNEHAVDARIKNKLQNQITKAQYNLFLKNMPWDDANNRSQLKYDLSKTLLLDKVFASHDIHFLSQKIDQLLDQTPVFYSTGIDGGKFSKGDKNFKILSNTQIRAASNQVYELLNTISPKDQESIERIHNIKISVDPETRKCILGIGGEGKVRLARNTVTGDIVAVKKSETHVAKRELAQFEGLHGIPGLSTPLDYAHIKNADKGKSYIFLSLADLGDGNKAVKKQSRTRALSLDKANQNLKSTARQYISCVATLHRNGKAHRDIKPSNFLHSSKNPIQLADFGIATNVHNPDFMQTIGPDFKIAGTPGYFPPEMLYPTVPVYNPQKHDDFSLGESLLQLKYGAFDDHEEAQKRTGIEKLAQLGKHLNIDGQTVKIEFSAANNCKGIDRASLPASVAEYNTLDKIIAGLLDRNPLTRLTSEQAHESAFFKTR